MSKRRRTFELSMLGTGLVALALAVGCNQGGKGGADAKKGADAGKGAATKNLGKESTTLGKLGTTDLTKKSEGKDEKKAPPKMVDLDLSEAGAEATIKAPEGAKAEKSHGPITVRNHDYGFDLELHEGKSDFKAEKKRIEADTTNKLENWVTQDDEQLLFESRFSSFSRTEFHFLMQAPNKIGGKAWHCRDRVGASFTREEVDRMIEACKSLTGK